MTTDQATLRARQRSIADAYADQYGDPTAIRNAEYALVTAKSRLAAKLAKLRSTQALYAADAPEHVAEAEREVESDRARVEELTAALVGVSGNRHGGILEPAWSGYLVDEGGTVHMLDVCATSLSVERIDALDDKTPAEVLDALDGLAPICPLCVC